MTILIPPHRPDGIHVLLFLAWSSVIPIRLLAETKDLTIPVFLSAPSLSDLTGADTPQSVALLYEQLTLSISQQLFVTNQRERSYYFSAFRFRTPTKRQRGRGDEEVRWHVEGLLLGLDSSGEFSRPRKGETR